MGNRVECFMLSCTPALVKTAHYNTIRACEENKGGTCYALADVPPDLSYSQVIETAGRYLPANCVTCGKPVEFGICDTPSLSTSSERWHNPLTGKSSTRVHDVATPGAMWECDWLTPESSEDSSYLSRFYMQDRAAGRTRAPITMCLPGGHDWCLDSKARNGDGWVITGNAPCLTEHPSIQTPSYHGWLRNGFLEDC